MKHHNLLVGIAGVAGLTMLVWAMKPEPPIAFDDLDEAWTSITTGGLHCQSSFPNGNSSEAFMVSREQACWEVVNNLCKVGSMNPAWKGRVWVNRITSNPYYFMPDDADVRVWGNVYAFGDREMLREIEVALQRQRAASRAFVQPR